MKLADFLVLISVGSFYLSGCATHDNQSISDAKVVPKQSPKFGLTYDYSMVQPAKTDITGARVFNYNNPQFNKKTYNAVIIEPVVFYQEITSAGLNSRIAANARISLQHYLEKIIGNKLRIVSAPGVNVLTLRLVVAGARLESESGYRPLEFLPVEQILNLNYKNPDKDGYYQALELGVRITDSQSGMLLGASVVSLRDSKLREEVHSNDGFQRLLEMWAAIAVKYAANYKVVK